MKKMEKKDFDFEEWQNLIGRAIIASGDIELASYKCLTYLPSDDIFEIVADLPFAKRVDLICKIIEEKPLPDDLRADFLQLLSKAKKSAETRNLIAHNPVQISVYKHEKSGDVFLRPEIQAIRKKNKVMTLTDMRKFTAEVEELSMDIHAVMGQLFAACDRISKTEK